MKKRVQNLLRKKNLSAGIAGWSKVLPSLLTLLFLSSTLVAQHPAGPSKKIGTLNEFYEKFRSGQSNARLGREKSLETTEGVLQALINVTKIEEDTETLLGEIVGRKASNVSFTLSNGKLEGFAVLPSEEKAYNYSSDADGNVFVSETDIHDVLCINYGDVENAAGTSGDVVLAVPPSTSTVYTLQSLPGVTAVAYLDFDGQVVSGTRWNGGNTINAVPGNFTETDITNIWKMISEDYRPFNINVTTNVAVFNAAPRGRRMRCIFTPTNTAAPGSGGVAYLNSFRWTDDTPCWVFNGGAKVAGEAGSHELGHTFGLGHDGTPSTGYYSGHGIWAPIMGVGYSRGLVQWSRGEYANANNTQDDIAIIANTSNGFGFRADDAGNTVATAKALVVGSTGSVTGSQNYGVITQRTDIDVYRFTTSGGAISFTINPAPSYPDLDILAQLTNDAGTVLLTSNPTASAPGSQTGTNPITGLGASFSTTLSAGTYYLHIDGTGQGSPLNTGYSDYASLGEYTISGSIPISTSNQPPTVSITSPLNNSSFVAPASITINASASDVDGTISSVSFYNGTTLIATDATSPYSFAWTGVAANSYIITARATDNSGNTTTSAAVNIVVTNPAPSVAITSPLPNTAFTAPATIVINATASDANGTVSSVSFFNGSVLLGTDATSPYSFTWNNVQAGTYNLTARATDNGGLSTTSVIVPIVVNSGVNQAPAVSITAPSDNATFFAPATINVNVSATDIDGTIASVALYRNSVLVATDLTAPYSFSLTNVPVGRDTLRAVATDNLGASTTSSSVLVRIDPFVNQAPAVSITAPLDNATFFAPANINVNISATDIDGTIASVALYRNSVLVATDLTVPYAFILTNVPLGRDTLRAVATDNLGATTTSASVLVRIDPAVNQAPLVNISAPLNNATFIAPASITINATASDPDGSISSVAFYNGTTLLGTDVSSPYSFSWSGVAAGSYNITARATDNSGASTTSSIVSIVVSTSSTFGINGPSCVNTGQATLFTLNPEGTASNVSWWTNAQAMIQVDPLDKRRATITYPYPASTITITAGVNYSTYPWYREYTKTIQVGACGAASSAAVLAAPHPFNEETTLSITNGEKIISVKLYDLRGMEILSNSNLNNNSITIGQDLKAGIYIIHVITENGTYMKNIIKSE